MFELNNMNKQMKNHSVIVSLCLLIYPIDIGIIILPILKWQDGHVNS